MQTKIHSLFEEVEKEIQVNFDILDKTLIQRVARDGTRVLHLTSDMRSPDEIFVEGENGMCEPIKTDDLYKLFDMYCKQDENGRKRL